MVRLFMPENVNSRREKNIKIDLRRRRSCRRRRRVTI